MANRDAYLTAALDQLGAAIDRNDIAAAEKIYTEMQQHDLGFAKRILERLIAAGMRRVNGGR